MSGKGRHYPNMPPLLAGEDNDHYSNRMIGVYGPDAYPYDHVRNRQCALGWHNECSERTLNEDHRRCQCPCHEPEPREEEKPRPAWATQGCPTMMVAHHSVPVLVLEWGWCDAGYGPIPLGGGAAVLADLGHVVEPRVVALKHLETFEGAAAYHELLALDAQERAEEEQSRAARAMREANRLRRYALLNGCDW